MNSSWLGKTYYFTINSCLDFGQELCLTTASICKNCQYKMYQLERDLQEKEVNEEDGAILAWKMSEFNLKCRCCFSVTTSSSIEQQSIPKASVSNLLRTVLQKRGAWGCFLQTICKALPWRSLRGIKDAIRDNSKAENVF